MAMWDPSYVITFPFATQPPIDPIRGWENLRDITRQKIINRLHIELGVCTQPLADPLQALAHLDVAILWRRDRSRGCCFCAFSPSIRPGGSSRLKSFSNQAILS
jgi:hypothetical protein